MTRDNFNPLPFKITLPGTDHHTHIAPMGASDDIFVDEAGNILKKDIYKQGDERAASLLNIPSGEDLKKMREKRSFAQLAQTYGLNAAMIDGEGYAYRIVDEGDEETLTTKKTADPHQLIAKPQSGYRRTWKVLIDLAQRCAAYANSKDPGTYDIDGENRRHSNLNTLAEQTAYSRSLEIGEITFDPQMLPERESYKELEKILKD